jgi:hypothetical protein
VLLLVMTYSTLGHDFACEPRPIKHGTNSADADSKRTGDVRFK